jgi:hypothetical protein
MRRSLALGALLALMLLLAAAAPCQAATSDSKSKGKKNRRNGPTTTPPKTTTTTSTTTTSAGRNTPPTKIIICKRVESRTPKWNEIEISIKAWKDAQATGKLEQSCSLSRGFARPCNKMDCADPWGCALSEWTDTSAGCQPDGQKEQVRTIVAAAKFVGTACPSATELTRKEPCPFNCVLAETYTDGPCQPDGTLTRTYDVQTPAAGGGACLDVKTESCTYGVVACGGATSCTFSFTNCGATGRIGPTQEQCAASYPELMSSQVSVSEGIQSWTVPVARTYRITACGAQGASASSGYYGGKGACMRGDFDLTSGTVLRVLVGQLGVTDLYSGGGGGGSFVVTSDGSILAIGGGGGGLLAGFPMNGGDGQVETSGQSYVYLIGGAGGVDGAGGGFAWSWGAGGGGYSGNGENDYEYGEGYGDYYFGYGGTAFINGGNGGEGISCGYSGFAHGGFGGGGSGNGCFGGGGGGGYSGGGGGGAAGGGGSYNTGNNKVNEGGVQSGMGSVTIEMLE